MLNDWNSSIWAKNGTRSCAGSAERSIATSCMCETSKEPMRFVACSPIWPLARLAMTIWRWFIAYARSNLGATWPRISRMFGDVPNCPALFRIGATASVRKRRS